MDETLSPGSRPSSVDGDNTAKTTGARRPSLGLRRSSPSLGRPSSNPNLRQTGSRQSRLSRTPTDFSLPRISEYPVEDAEEPAQWHSASLLFVALPAFAGIFFENGSAIMTDVLMLALGCLFLYWSVKWPWQWYYAAQAVAIANGYDPNGDVAVYDSSEGEGLDEDEERQEKQSSSDPPEDLSPKLKREQMKRDAAAASLQSDEKLALFMCFISPIVVAYILHAIRPYLSRPSGGIVSNSNLTLFVLAAEVRPFLHLFQLVEARTTRLQRVVSSYPTPESDDNNAQLETMTQRIADLESRITAGTVRSTEKDQNGQVGPAIEKSVRQSLQPQLDALNRAVRRYEKRATTQAIVTEARLQDLEGRLKDALSLAAAASRNQHRPGLIGSLMDWIGTLFMAPLEGFGMLLRWPFHLAGELYRFLLGPRRKRKPKGKYSADSKVKPRLEQY